MAKNLFKFSVEGAVSLPERKIFFELLFKCSAYLIDGPMA